MANEISLVTASGRTVTPKDDGIIYEVFSPGNGIIYGGAVTIKDSSTLHITAGHGIVCGRMFTIDDSDIPVALSGSGSLLGRLYIHLDLADAADPITLLVETGASLTPVVQDSDVNINNGVYEINIATFDVDTSTISNLVNLDVTVAPMGDMEGATAGTDGKGGYVPAPQAGDEDKVLKGDGTWGTAGDTATVKYDDSDDTIYLMYQGAWTAWKVAGLAYPVGTQTTFSYKGSVDQFEIPASGYWKVELYGAGTGESTAYEAKGGKTTLYEEFQAGDIIYVCVGGTTNGATGGYNGGASGYYNSNSSGTGGAGGTHIAKMDGTLEAIGSSNIDKVLGVAGGAGGYMINMRRGGKGGGVNGENGGQGEAAGLTGKGATQSAAGANAVNTGSITITGSYPGGFGIGGRVTVSSWGGTGGGGGLYGGGAGAFDSGAGAGSGYIKDTASKTIGGVTYTPDTTQGGGLASNGSCVFTYMGR